MNYILIIKVGLFTFPLLAFLITLPYIIKEYHKYGSVYWVRALIIYSFILYLLIAFFLVILPLPTREEVLALNTPRTQLIPFKFVVDFFTKGNFESITGIINTLKSNFFYVPIFNILLTIPFGIYMHYYYKLDLKKTTIATFGLSLFFEITQLTGLYFIYPRGYRLFDVDDLILNTIGGFLGYFIGNFVLKILPNRNEIDQEAFKLGMKVSALRRCLTFMFDLIFATIVYTILVFIINKKISYILFIIIYTIVVKYILKGSTPAMKFFKLNMTDLNNSKLHLWQIIIHTIIFYLELFLIPFVIFYYVLIIVKNINSYLLILVMLILRIVFFIYYLIIFIRYLKKDQMLYEKLSKTKISSTIVIEDN